MGLGNVLFETLKHVPLLEKVLSSNYPPGPACLGLQLHFDPRIFEAEKAVSAATTPEHSILAGCKQSVAFTRAYLREQLGVVQEATHGH